MNAIRLTRFADNSFQIVLFVMLLGLLVASGWFTYQAEQVANHSYSSVVNAVDNPPAQITNFDQCVAAGNPVQQSSPEICTTKSGQQFPQQ